MQTASHRWAGALTALTWAHLTHPDRPAVPIAVGVATLTAGGALSPDADQRWKLADSLIPDEILGGGGPLAHRGLTHWWGWPAGVAVLAALWPAPWPLTAALYGVALGWGSHVLCDALIGAEGYGHRRGVPVFLWFGAVGTGLRNDGIVATVLGGLLPLATAWAAVTLAINAPLIPTL